MIFKNMKLSVLFFTVGLFVLTSGTIAARANAALDQVAISLSQGKYKEVVRSVSKIIAAKSKADVVAQALLYRGIAYRNQGKVAQAIADFSNAEWVRKLKGSSLRRLYAERALAYDAVGQKTLAAKDRQLAGSKNIQLAQRASAKNGISLTNNAVRQTSVEASKSTTQELFGGLQNLFGFNNNNPKQKIVVKNPSVKQGLGVNNDGSTFREIPTLDSHESKKNSKKLKTAALPPKQKAEALSQNNVPSNSAWAAKRADEIQANKKQTQGQLKKVNGLTTSSPVKLTPKKLKEPKNTNVVGKFFNNIFGGETKKEAAPINPGDDVIVAEQVQTPIVPQTPQKVAKKTVKKRVVKKQPVKRAPVKKAAQRTKVAAVSKKVATPKARSLYHVQLGAFGEAGAADKFVNRLNSKYKSLVGNKTAMVVETDLGNSRRQYRVFLGPYRSREKGNKTCSVLTRLGLGCSIVE